LNQEVAKAMTAGRRAGIEIDENQALRWITANAAWVLGIDERTGTLETGKMADVVVWSGHPFSVYSRAERVYIDGVLTHDRAQPMAPTDFELGIGPNEASPVERPR
jgi:imidazolonepropionase-like amidohydrolase